MHRLLIAATALALFAATGLALPPPASAGSGCDALLKAAKKGYRGDPGALNACRQGAASAAHAVRARPSALQTQDYRDRQSYRRQKRQFDKALKGHDTATLAQMQGRTKTTRVGRNVRSNVDKEARRQQALSDAVNLAIILNAIGSGGGGGGGHH